MCHLFPCGSEVEVEEKSGPTGQERALLKLASSER